MYVLILDNLTNSSSVATLGVCLGLASHWFYFIHGEHHLHAQLLARVAIFSPALFLVALVTWLRLPLGASLTATATLFSCFHASLFTSILVYRYFFHPLRRFPGPTLAKLSKLYHFRLCLRENNCIILAKWHARYGPIVRVGPNELSLMHPDAIPAIYGSQSQCRRAPWYDMAHPNVSLQSSRDQVLHDRRRRVWDKGFSIKG